jgi:uncharacterized protein (DUF2384 family)
MKPKTRDKKSTRMPSQRRLREAIDRQVRTYNRLRRLLHLIDADVLQAGRMLFTTDSGLALWLCEPVQALGGKVPLRVMRTADGRRQVASILRAIAHGVYL